MIKNSKLIGTKIKAPFGWQKFKVGELFDVKLSKSDNKLAELPVGNIPLISAGADNQGIVGYIGNDLLNTMPFKNSITADMFGNWFLHVGDFYTVSHGRVNILTPMFDYDEAVCEYICAVGAKVTCGLYGFDNMLSSKKLVRLFIELPVTAANQPDFEWMSDYIKVVKADYLEQKALSNRNEIEAYLAAGKTDSMNVTDDDRQFLRDFAKLPRRKFKVGELFDFKSSMSLDKSDLTFVSKNNPFAIPYITRTVSNNGINGYVDSRLVDNEYINAGNEFAFGLLGLTAFYQCNNYCTGQFVKRFVPKFKLTELLAMFFKTLLDRQIEVFKTVSIRSYSQLIDNTLEIELPVIDSSQVDVQSIEKYMQIQSKPLINKVAETLVPVRGGATLIDFVAIERYMQIQIKLTIAKRAKYLDKELALMKTV